MSFFARKFINFIFTRTEDTLLHREVIPHIVIIWLYLPQWDHFKPDKIRGQNELYLWSNISVSVYNKVSMTTRPLFCLSVLRKSHYHTEMDNFNCSHDNNGSHSGYVLYNHESEGSLVLTVNRLVVTLSLLLHLVILVRITHSHFHHLRPVHVFQINYFLGLCLLCTSGESQLYWQGRNKVPPSTSIHWSLYWRELDNGSYGFKILKLILKFRNDWIKAF